MPPKTKEITMFPVYAKKSVMGEVPMFWVDRDEKDWLLSSGAAISFKKRGTALRLTRDRMIGDSTDMRDKSAQMGPSVIEANADRKKWAEQIVAEWAKTGIPRMRAACK